MTQHLINNNFNVERMSFCNQLVKIFQRSKNRIDVTIVADIVAEIFHRRFEKRRNPNSLYTEAGNVIKLGNNALQIANTVVVRIHQTARINLIDHRPTPPGCRIHNDTSLARKSRTSWVDSTTVKPKP